MGSIILTEWPSTIIVAILLGLALLLRYRGASRTQKLPPGPSGLPWIGQAFDIPGLHSHLYFTDLQRTHGDVVSLTAMGKKFIILNSYEVAFEFLGKRGAIHCDRPSNPYITRFLGAQNGLPLLNANQDWKESRRLFQMMLNKEASRRHYAEAILSRVQRFALHVIENGQDKQGEMLDKLIHNIILHSAFGLDLQDNDPIVLNAIKGTEIVSAAALPTKHLVNMFPILQHLPAWVPFQPWRTEAAESRKVLHPMLEIPWQHAVATKAEGAVNESVAHRLLSEQTSTNSHLLPAIAGMNLIAGGETLVGVSRLFILAMILHPKVQRKAQEELDNVVGHDRLPTVDDIPNLPYLEAVIKEVFRWQPVAPISVPTLPRKTDYYQDYCIPTKTVVIHNIWALSRDEKMYPDADSFNPDRFLVDNPPRDPRLWSFGIGRRICPGIAYAEEVYTTLFMTLLATVNIMPALDKDGKEPPNAPSVRTTGRPVNVLIPFSYRMHPRSDVAVSLLHSSVLA